MFRILPAGLILWLAWQPLMVAGTWAPLASAPPQGVNHPMLLSDGTIYTDNGSGQCCRLAPDIHGSYQNGTWTHFSTMNYTRLFFTSCVLTNGKIFVAGGEYGTGRRHAELFDPLNDVWTRIPDPLPGPAFSDSIGKLLPNGNVLVAPVSQFGGCVIYNVAANSWQTAGKAMNQNEVCWVKLTNDCILTIDTAAQTSEHYVPSLNRWVADGNVPVVIYGQGAELGPGFLLPNGNAFFIGGSTNTAIYTPGAVPTSAGSWIAGPTMVFGTNLLGAVDAPAAMMVNGKILCALGPIAGTGPTSFYEYDYVANAFTAVTAPNGSSTYKASAPFGTSMLTLPDGNVLFVGGQNSQSLYIYKPDGTPLPEGQPAIYSLSENFNGSYHLTGTNLTGISEGAAYGDDLQMDCNYPLVRLTNSVSGNVYYARTFNWTSTSVQTRNKVIATEFVLPQNLPAGTYSLVVVANGNPSAPTNFTYSPATIPTALSAESGNRLVNLSWTAVSGATAYNVKRSDRATGYFSTITTLSGTNSYTDTNLTNGLAYYYKIAAVGSQGPSSDSTAVSATPSGPPFIPGAAPVNLAPLYNRAGIYTDGRSFSGGLDGSGGALSANLLGTALAWNNLVFGFGPPNVVDVVSCSGQTISVAPGQFNTLQLLATAVNGSQAAQTFTVTYTDNSTATFTQSFSDWVSQQSFSGETRVLTMSYRNRSGGASQTLNVFVDGYVFTLDQTKTVKSITLAADSNLILLAMTLAMNPAPVTLTAIYNEAGIYADGSTFTNPATGGIDGTGHAYSGTLLGGSQTWNNTLFNFGPIDSTNVVSCDGQTIALPAGNYAAIRLLATGVNGNQPSQSFTVTYTDLSTATFVQSFSDWFGPQNYPGETKAIPMGYRNSSNGSSSENNSLYLYGYTFALDPTKAIQSLLLPSDANVVIAAVSAVPNWPPAFSATDYTLANAPVGTSYSASLAADASDLNGDKLTFAKVSGPDWLNVAADGSLSGTPLGSDVGTNTLVVSVTDPWNLSATATLTVVVQTPAPIMASLTNPSGQLLLSWTGGTGPYQVQQATNLDNPVWQTFGASITGNSISLPPTNSAAFYRVVGQ
ncbi:MAG TPA: putative Ig domain-containing protein [Verrucomicrobiae bacterium]|nr:putative Ig domain-containing protein [Verrucomicrobiae bacterium]